MRIFDRYIGKQVLVGTLYAVSILGIVLVFGGLFQKIQPLLVENKAPLGLVLQIAALLLPASLMFTVPWGFLTAVLLVFGRLSSNDEITGFRVAGLSLGRLAAPVFAIGLLLSLASLWINTNVIPWSRSYSMQLVYDQALRDPDSILKPGSAQEKFGSDRGSGELKLLVEGKKDDWVEGFHLYQLPPNDQADGSVKYVHAQKAALTVDQVNRQLRVKLQNAYFETRNAKGELESAFAGQAEPLVIDLQKPNRKKPVAMTNGEITARIAENPAMPVADRVSLQSEITKRYSFSMACLAFAFVAVPLGMNARRKETSGGIIVSLIIAGAYFLVTMLADQFKTDLGATLVLWSPNLICVLIGLYLFRRARFR
jgi:lipopolysaccharide export LptBFGC system permease protein LptF